MNQRIPALRVLNCRFLAWVMACFFILAGRAQAVPQAPNESWIVGEVVDIERLDSLTLNIQPQQNLFRYKLLIVTIEAIPGAENGLRGDAGKTIEALSRDGLGTGAVKGKLVRVRIAYQGDERSGRYWILESAAMARPR